MLFCKLTYCFFDYFKTIYFTLPWFNRLSPGLKLCYSFIYVLMKISAELTIYRKKHIDAKCDLDERGLRCRMINKPALHR